MIDPLGKLETTRDPAASAGPTVSSSSPEPVSRRYRLGFDPVYDLSAVRATFDERRGGLGLALPIARRVVERHGGFVWAPEHAEDRGAAIVAFPLSE